VRIPAIIEMCGVIEEGRSCEVVRRTGIEEAPLPGNQRVVVECKNSELTASDHESLVFPSRLEPSFRISSPCLWATTKYENGGPVKVVILWNYESVN
jgi:hypothetical protein